MRKYGACRQGGTNGVLNLWKIILRELGLNNINSMCEVKRLK